MEIKNFKVYESLVNVKDSMELDSDQTLASAEFDNGYTMTLEVRGAVKVYYDETENNDSEYEAYYTRPSEFPKSLKELIHNDPAWWTLNENVYISENNWFELFLWDEKGGYIVSDVVDAEGQSDDEIKSLFLETAKEYLKWMKRGEEAA